MGAYLNLNGKIFLASLAAMVGSKIYAAHKEAEATSRELANPTRGMDPETAAMYYQLRQHAVKEDWDTYYGLVSKSGMSMAEIVRLWENLKG